jgi:hypothetical protein
MLGTADSGFVTESSGTVLATSRRREDAAAGTPFRR